LIVCTVWQSWRNPEDAFYWDPVFAKVMRHYKTSSVTSSVTLTRALTRTVSKSNLNATWRTDAEVTEQVLAFVHLTLYSTKAIIMPYRSWYTGR